MISPLAIITNAGSGSSSTSEESIREAFGEYGSEVEILDIKKGSEAIEAIIRREAVKMVVAAGGDGTVNFVANVAVKLGLPMGVLPLGTLNHFAKDISLPSDLKGTAKVIIEGQLGSFDYCTVNDNVFVNNSSIGLYPSTVRHRERLQPRFGKWPAATLASIRALFILSTTHLRFTFTGANVVFKTPLAFIGNNSYNYEKIGFTNRHSLQTGKLFLYVVHANRITGLISIVILAFFGKRLKNKDYLANPSSELVITSRKQSLRVAVDGEVLTLESPLRYVMHPRGLSVCIASPR